MLPCFGGVVVVVVDCSARGGVCGTFREFCCGCCGCLFLLEVVAAVERLWCLVVETMAQVEVEVEQIR